MIGGSRQRGRRQGFALVTALWALVIVGVLALEFAAVGQAGRQAALNVRSSARARWAARAGLARSLDVVDRALRANAFAPAGDTLLGPLRYAVDGVPVVAVVLDARGRVQLNLAQSAELRALFEALDVPAAEADRLSDAVLDWRDADQLHRPRGAERGDYVARRSAPLPKDAPFERVEELRTVLGVSDALYRRVSPYLTVAGDGRVNVNSASVPVLLTLPGLDPGVAGIVVARRSRAPYRNLFELLGSLPQHVRARMQARMGALADRVAFTPREVEVVVGAAPGAGGAGARLTATLRLSGGSGHTLLRSIER